MFNIAKFVSNLVEAMRISFTYVALQVTKLFQKIHSFLEDDHTLIFLLIGEYK